MRVAALTIVTVLVGQACRTELDLDRGRRYACARDAGVGADGGTDQCSAGFRCGLDGYCFDPDAGEPRACEGPLDCSTGWRCGLAVNGVGACQRVGVPAPYPCLDDSWCEGGWRCGPGGVCLEATNDALLAPPGRARPASILSPAPFPLRGFGAAMTDNGEWQAIALGPGAVQVLTVGQREFWARRLPIDGGLFAVRSGDVLAVADDRGSTQVGPIIGQDVSLAPVAFPGFRPTGLVLSPGYKPHWRPNLPAPGLLIAWTPSRFAAWNLDGHALEPLPAPPGATAAIDTWRTPITRGPREESRLVAATSQGLFELIRDGDGGWTPLPSSRKCGAPIAARYVETGEEDGGEDAGALQRGNSPPAVAALFQAQDGGTPCGVLYDRLADGGVEAAVEAEVCDSESTATGLRPADEQLSGVWVQCRAPGGTVREVGLCRSTNCPASAAPAAQERARASARDSDVIVDELGFTARQQFKTLERPLFGSGVGTWGVERDTLVSVTRGADGGLEVLGRRAAGDGGLVRFTDVAGVGFVRASGDDGVQPLTNVVGWPGVRVLANGEIRTGDEQALARVDPIRPLEGDVTAVGRPEGDGGFLYVSSFDALFAGPINPEAPMALRLVPASRSAITSLAAAPGPVSLPDGGVVQRWGYLVAQGRLFRFESRNRVWRSDEIELPELAVSVWFDGVRGRVGTSTGRVFGLPTRVPLSEPLAGAATSYASLCGHAFAATPAGVFTLERPDAGLATWRLHEELALALPRRSGAGLPGDGLRLIPLDTQLVAVNADGVVASIAFECGGAP
ncbi:MAG: hypothetical protein JNJ54_22480 [Myxococcaceae bacterium]|nr:hypothetical protein [Myxococcaceae bacterium]